MVSTEFSFQKGLTLDSERQLKMKASLMSWRTIFGHFCWLYTPITGSWLRHYILIISDIGMGEKTTISELGSLGEVIGALGLIVTLVCLEMEMRLYPQAEDNRDLEQVQISALEIQLGAAENPEFGNVLSKWNRLTGGKFLPLPPHIDHAALQDIFDEEELTTLN